MANYRLTRGKNFYFLPTVTLFSFFPYFLKSDQSHGGKKRKFTQSVIELARFLQPLSSNQSVKFSKFRQSQVIP
jgi:hypothetical protein